MTAAIVLEIAEKAFIEGLEILQIIELMQKQNTGRINGNLTDGGAARAGVVIRNSLISRLTLLTAGAMSPVNRADDRHVRKAVELLQDPTVRRDVQSMGGQPNRIAQFERLWAELDADPRRTVVKHFRDKWTAHSAVPNPQIRPPTYDEMFAFSKAIAGAIESFAHAVGVTRESHQDTMDEMISASQEFWRPWEFMHRR